MSVAYEAAKTAHFGAHPLGNSILGTVESITALDGRPDARLLRAAVQPGQHRAGIRRQGRLGLAGRSGRSALRRLAGRRGDPRRPSRFAARAHSGRSSAPTTSSRPSSASCDAPPLESADRYAAHLLATILGDHTGSRLYWTLIDPGLADGAELSYQDYNQAGAFFTFLSCEPDVDPGQPRPDRRGLPDGDRPRADRGRADPGQEQGARPLGAPQRAPDGPARLARVPLDVPPRLYLGRTRSSRPSTASRWTTCAGCSPTGRSGR